MKKLVAIIVFSAFAALFPLVATAAQQGMNTQSTAKETVKCPICGDTVNPKTAKESWTYKGKKYYFGACCSKQEIAKFKKNPEKYPFFKTK
ncbi:MAG: YHS domain-containing protein [Nitrospirota bacterium]